MAAAVDVAVYVEGVVVHAVGTAFGVAVADGTVEDIAVGVLGNHLGDELQDGLGNHLVGALQDGTGDAGHRLEEQGDSWGAAAPHSADDHLQYSRVPTTYNE